MKNKEFTELIPNLYWNCNPSTNKNILVLRHPQMVNYYMPLLKDKIWKSFSNVTIWQTNTEIQETSELLNEVEKMDVIIVLVSEMFMSTQHAIRNLVLPYIISKGIPRPEKFLKSMYS